MAKFRPTQPIIAITMNEKVYNQLALCYNVESKVAVMLDSMDKIISQANKQVKACGFANKGDNIVITTGFPVKNCRETNVIISHVVE